MAAALARMCACAGRSATCRHEGRMRESVKPLVSGPNPCLQVRFLISSLMACGAKDTRGLELMLVPALSRDPSKRQSLERSRLKAWTRGPKAGKRDFLKDRIAPMAATLRPGLERRLKAELAGEV